jgi:sulfur dioxygenase
MIFKQLFDHESSTFTYLIAKSKGSPAILIDPVLEQTERDLKLVKELDLDLVYMLNTHCHADHITGTGKIKKSLLNAKSMISIDSGAKADLYLQDNQEVEFGGLKLIAIKTPGHTNGCMCFYFPEQGWLFTGDALLIRGCGRTDFQQGDAGLLYDGIHSKIFTLPKQTIVYPAHDYKGHCSSTIEEEIQWNPRFTKSRPDFIEFMKNLGLAYPKKIDVSLPANLNCGIDFE